MKNFDGVGIWSTLTSALMVVGLSTTLMAASAPFDPDETKPADTDIVSQYPAIERTFRDIIESWLVVDHDKTVGGHNQLTLVDQTTDPTFASGVVGVWNNGGVLSTRVASGTVSAISAVPPGSMVDYAGSSAPDGWLLAYGQCVSRTTYATLFAVIGTTYDNSCSGSDFGIPDTRGRVVAGEDDMGGTSANRLTDAGTTSLNGDTLGDTGGAETHTLLEAEVPSHDHDYADPGHSHTGTFGTSAATYLRGGTGNSSTEGGAKTTDSANTGITHNSFGDGGAHVVVQPTIVLMKIIKT